MIYERRVNVNYLRPYNCGPYLVILYWVQLSMFKCLYGGNQVFVCFVFWWCI